MVGHQAVSQNVYLVFIAICLQPTEIGISVVIREKDILSSVSTLSNVAWYTGKHSSA
jgi:hypothetical protein